MSEIEVAGASLEAAHRQLLDVLSRLDAAGEYVAAAHLIAAIDALEDRLPRPVRKLGQDEANPISTVARRMVESFGDRAQAVARRQLEESNGATFAAWAAIISRMGD